MLNSALAVGQNSAATGQASVRGRYVRPHPRRPGAAAAGVTAVAQTAMAGDVSRRRDDRPVLDTILVISRDYPVRLGRADGVFRPRCQSRAYHDGPAEELTGTGLTCTNSALPIHVAKLAAPGAPSQAGL